MKKFILTFLFLNITLCAHSDIVIENIPNIYFKNEDGTTYTPDSANYPKVSEIEHMIFKKTFEKEPITIRVNRLEQKIYNKSDITSPLSDRISNIMNYLEEQTIGVKERATLNILEQQLFKTTYSNNTASKRIENLERHILGANQQGDLITRLNTLKTASTSTNSNTIPSYTPNVPNYYQNTYPNNYAYNQQPQQKTGIKDTLKNVFNVFQKGQPTGYEPPIYQQNYPNYSQPYPVNTNNYGQYYPNGNAQMQYYQQQQLPQPYYKSFYDAQSGNEMYYDNGEYRKDLRSTGGGLGVQIIN